MAAGFYFLRFHSVSTTFAIAVLINLVVGFTSLLLQAKSKALLEKEKAGAEPITAKQSVAPEEETNRFLPLKLVLWG
jgi:hypothetical protein